MASVTVSHRYAAAPERVFDAWVDPAVAGRFLFKTPTGKDLRAEIDARVGGSFRILETRPEVGEAEHLGEYEVVERPHRLVFKVWSPTYPGPVTRVTVEIAPAPGGCVLTLTQAALPEEWVEPLAVGWRQVLEALDGALGEMA